MGFSVLTTLKMEREPKNERGGRGRERKETPYLTFLPHPLPALLLAPFFRHFSRGL